MKEKSSGSLTKEKKKYKLASASQRLDGKGTGSPRLIISQTTPFQ